MLKPQQLQLLEEMVSHPNKSFQDMADTIGINPNTLTKWKRLPEFQAELQKRMREVWEDIELPAINTMKTLVREGDFKASKYVLDNLGYAPAQKIEADVNTDINITIGE